jgi:hypothetical protein
MHLNVVHGLKTSTVTAHSLLQLASKAGCFLLLLPLLLLLLLLPLLFLLLLV